MKTVLLIEDHEILLRALVRGLQSHFDVAACSTLAAALALFEAGRRFDAILCDMFLGDGTGEDLYARLRELSVEQSDRVLFLSGREGSRRDAPFFRATRGRHLLKPITKELLIANLTMMAGDAAERQGAQGNDCKHAK